MDNFKPNHTSFLACVNIKTRKQMTTHKKTNDQAPFIDPKGKIFKPKICDCIYLLILGKTIKEIAYELDISPRTVEEYIKNLKRNFKCTSKSQILSRLIKCEKNKSNIICFLNDYSSE